VARQALAVRGIGELQRKRQRRQRHRHVASERAAS
jgi:hypothetical protein